MNRNNNKPNAKKLADGKSKMSRCGGGVKTEEYT